MCECGVKLTFKGDHAVCGCGKSFTKDQAGVRRNEA
jgi:hypothetical protein